MAIQELHLKITGMTCGHCSKFVTTTIQELDGIESVIVDHVAGLAQLRIQNPPITPEQIVAYINETETYQAEIIPQ